MTKQVPALALFATRYSRARFFTFRLPQKKKRKLTKRLFSLPLLLFERPGFCGGGFLAPISFFRAPSVPSNCVAFRRAHHFLLVLARFFFVRSCAGLAFRVRSTVVCCRGLCPLSGLARTRKRALYRTALLPRRARRGAFTTELRGKHLPSKAPQGCIAWTTAIHAPCPRAYLQPAGRAA